MLKDCSSMVLSSSDDDDDTKAAARPRFTNTSLSLSSLSSVDSLEFDTDMVSVSEFESSDLISASEFESEFQISFLCPNSSFHIWLLRPNSSFHIWFVCLNSSLQVWLPLALWLLHPSLHDRFLCHADSRNELTRYRYTTKELTNYYYRPHEALLSIEASLWFVLSLQGRALFHSELALLWGMQHVTAWQLH